MEACYIDCPSFILNIEPDDNKRLNVFNFVNQYQNKKYLIDQSNINTINSIEELENALKNINKVQFMELNYKIRSQFPAQSFQQICVNITKVMGQ